MLSTSGMLWLAVAPAGARSEMEDVLPRLAAIVRFATDLDARLRSAGLDGLASARELAARVVPLVATAAPQAGVARAAVETLVARLRAMEESLVALRRVKDELRRVP